MNQIVVKIEDKFINEAFQKWCFEHGLEWMSNGKLIHITDRILITYYTDESRFCLLKPTVDYSITHVLPNDWHEITGIILKLLKPKENKWTDDDMIRFAKQCDDNKYSCLDWYLEELKNFK